MTSQDTISPPAWGGMRIFGPSCHTGAMNMALDQVMLRKLENSPGGHYLRFYTWEPWAVSLGRNQKLPPPDQETLTALSGIDLVRRMTGGRAVLHGPELTYSIAFSRTSPLFGNSVAESYHHISAILTQGLAALGAQVTMASGKNSPRRGLGPDFCYGAASFHEILAQGRKLVGSAQIRSGDLVLQHGSIPISLPMNQLKALASWCGFPLDSLDNAASSLDQLLDPVPSLEGICNSLARAFSRALGESDPYDSTESNPSQEPIPETWLKEAAALAPDFSMSLITSNKLC